MAGMKRFVTYIYSYEDRKKGSNVGFAKVDIRGEECRIEIHLRGIYPGRCTCTVFLIREEEGSILGVPVGEFKIINGNGDFGTVVAAGQVGESPFGIREMEGVFLLGEDDRIFMSRWQEGSVTEIDKACLRQWKREAEREVESEIPANTSNTMHENLIATEIPMRNIFPEYNWSAVWENLKQTHPVCTPFEDHEIVCVRIELKDLRDLPKRYWYLGNNSFLLHGFFNYQHLLIGKLAEERWFIGIPGIYQRQERVMAAIFGFSEFVPAAVEEPHEDNGEPINRYGYWYRYMEE